jgi:hypothetical protein
MALLFSFGFKMATTTRTSNTKSSQLILALIFNLKVNSYLGTNYTKYPVLTNIQLFGSKAMKLRPSLHKTKISLSILRKFLAMGCWVSISNLMKNNVLCVTFFECLQWLAK